MLGAVRLCGQVSTRPIAVFDQSMERINAPISPPREHTAVRPCRMIRLRPELSSRQRPSGVKCETKLELYELEQRRVRSRTRGDFFRTPRLAIIGRRQGPYPRGRSGRVENDVRQLPGPLMPPKLEVWEVIMDSSRSGRRQFLKVPHWLVWARSCAGRERPVSRVSSATQRHAFTASPRLWRRRRDEGHAEHCIRPYTLRLGNLSASSRRIVPFRAGSLQAAGYRSCHTV
jgi:hypothetical protein